MCCTRVAWIGPFERDPVADTCPCGTVWRYEQPLWCRSEGKGPGEGALPAAVPFSGSPPGRLRPGSGPAWTGTTAPSMHCPRAPGLLGAVVPRSLPPPRPQVRRRRVLPRPGRRSPLLSRRSRVRARQPATVGLAPRPLWGRPAPRPAGTEGVRAGGGGHTRRAALPVERGRPSCQRPVPAGACLGTQLLLGAGRGPGGEGRARLPAAPARRWESVWQRARGRVSAALLCPWIPVPQRGTGAPERAIGACEAAWGALCEGCRGVPSNTSKKPVVIKDRTGK